MKTLVEVARQLKIPPTTLRNAAFKGKFAVQKNGRDLFIDVETEEFKSWLETHKARVEKKRP